MAVTSGDQDLFERISRKVNVEPIRALLVELQEKYPGEISSTGAKADLIEHLKSAVNSSRIKKDLVFGLLQEQEENGRQTILYYLPKSEQVKDRCSNPEEVATNLFGVNWRKSQNFPTLPRLTTGYQIVDFRTGYRGKPKDWLMKVYTFQIMKVQVRELQPEDTQNRNWGLNVNEFAVIYERVVTESVCVARWNDDPKLGLLELRVELAGRLPRFESDVQAIWTRLNPMFDYEKDFEPWELRWPLEKMLKECEGNGDIYELGLASLVDSGEYGVRYMPYTENDNIAATPVRMQTIKQILEDGGRCDRLVMTWKASASAGALEKDLRTYAGSRGDNELVIRSQISAQAVDYVTDRLRSFAS